jgi:hypothetical protein
MSDAVERILAAKRQSATTAEPSATGQLEDKFYSLLIGDGTDLRFFEVRFKDGTRLSLDYKNLNWFFYYPSQSSIEMDFNGLGIRINGRGLSDKLYKGIQQCRVAWIKEADSDWQDNKDNETYIESIEMDVGQGEESEEE